MQALLRNGGAMELRGERGGHHPLLLFHSSFPQFAIASSRDSRWIASAAATERSPLGGLVYAGKRTAMLPTELKPTSTPFHFPSFLASLQQSLSYRPFFDPY